MSGDHKKTGKHWKNIRVTTNIANKLKKGRQQSTPEQATNSEEREIELEPQKSAIIINDEIRALEIKSEDLEKLREPRPPSDPRSPATNTVVVRKLKPPSELNKPKPKPVTYARPAPPSAPLAPVDYSGAAGPRYNIYGDIVPHSILGSVEEYQAMAVTYGQNMPQNALSNRPESSQQLTVKYEKKKKPKPQFPKFASVDESNALRNWQIKMAERRRQQDHLTKKLNKAPDQLVMNQADEYRKTQEVRYIIDRTIPAMNLGGKGYRVGSEFWNQQEQYGDDLTGIHDTLTQTQKGYPPPIEHVGVAKTVLTEKGTAWDKPRTPLHKPWHRNQYLETRLNQLKPVIKELDPHDPNREDMLNLEVVGVGSQQQNSDKVDIMTESQMEREQEMYERQLEQEEACEEEEEDLDPLRDHPDVHPSPVFGPSLQFSGHPARWTGEGHNCEGQLGIEARVTFEAYATKRVTSFLEISNDGTTAVYYNWKKVPKTNPFDLVKERVQRFYFNTGNGVILPGDSMKFPFVFKSPNPGVFQEQWEFQTRPILCGGAILLVSLRGVSILEDKYKQERTQLEIDLSRKQANQIVHSIISEVLDGLRSPDRPSTPIDTYITKEEVFARANPGLAYHNERVKELNNLFLATFPEEEREETPQWDLSVSLLKDRIMSMDALDDKQDMLERLNQALNYMAFPSFSLQHQKMYNVCYEALCEMVDRVVSTALYYHEMLGIPDRDFESMPDDNKITLIPPHIKKSPVTVSRNSSSRSVERADLMMDKKKGKDRKIAKKTSDKKTSAKDSKPPAPASRGGGEKSSAKSGKATSAVGSQRKSPASANKEEGGVVTVESRTESPAATGPDPVVEAKYKDKVYSQAYVIVCDVVDNISDLLSAVQDETGGPKLPIML